MQKNTDAAVHKTILSLNNITFTIRRSLIAKETPKGTETANIISLSIAVPL